MNVRLALDDPLSIDAPLLAFPVFADGSGLEKEAARADDVLGGAFSRALGSGTSVGSWKRTSSSTLPRRLETQSASSSWVWAPGPT